MIIFMQLIKFTCTCIIFFVFNVAAHCSPVDIRIAPEYPGSPNASVAWSFSEQSSGLSHFLVVVETEDNGIVFEDSIEKHERRTTLKNLRPMTKHQVKVVAVYTDETQYHSSVELKYEGM